MQNTDSQKGISTDTSTSLWDRFALRKLDVLIIIIVALMVGFWVCWRGNLASEGKLKRPLRVGIVPWPGYAAGLVANNGLRPNKDSYFWNQHGLLVEFVVQSEESELLNDFANDRLDIIWSTVDSLAQQAPALKRKGIQPRAFMQVDWSRGGDAIIASAGIDRIEDLKGKKVAVSMSASRWLLEYSLKNSSLTDAERTAILDGSITTESSEKAGDLFANNGVDAAVLWEPDVTQAVQRRPGAHSLVDTSTAEKLIADVMVAKEEFIQEYPFVIKAFIDGWLVYGTTEATRNPMLAVKVLLDEKGFATLGEKKTHELLHTTKLATMSDNEEMFGLSGDGAFFDVLFNWASRLWLERGYISDAVPAEQARNIDLLTEIYKAHKPLPKPNCGTETPVALVKLAIRFAPDKADLADEAKSILDNQGALLMLQTHTGARFCIQSDPVEGDSPQNALEISRARENTVIEYLVEHYRRPRSQFASASSNASQQSNIGTAAQYIRLKLTGAVIQPFQN